VPESAFAGDSSLAAHTALASEFIEVAVRSSPFQGSLNPNIYSALDSLRQVVSLQKRHTASHETFRWPRQQPVPPGGFSQLPMPREGLVVEKLRVLKERPFSIFDYIGAFLTPRDFEQVCRKVYFGNDYSHTTFILVNAGLYYVLMEESIRETDPAAREEVRACRDMCQTNLETALGNLPLFMPATRESIEALLFGVFYAIDVSKPSLGWQMTSKAAELCHALGYHRAPRIPPGPDPTPDPDLDADAGRRKLLLWHVYIMDAALALRLGRASVMREWDITVGRDISPHVVPEPWRTMTNLWIRHAEIQNRLYKFLYSPIALSRTPSENELCARGLAKELIDLIADVNALQAAGPPLVPTLARTPRTPGPSTPSATGHIEGIDDLQPYIDQICLYTTLTLAYRAVPSPPQSPSRFCPECVNAARDSITIHQKAVERLGPDASLKVVYINWAIMLTPFVPFFVLICHVIDTSDLSDLQSLEHFAESLEPASPLSSPVQKLCRLCKVMCTVAKYYVEAKGQQREQPGGTNIVSIGDEFEMYLGALGVMPDGYQQQEQFQQQSQLSGMELVDWFSGNRNMMGLLEEDIPDFGAMSWASTS
jgi:hypothetical protein